MLKNYAFLATTIGSLPHINVNDALDLIFKTIPDAPVCPQLSKVSPNEDMLIQYTENFAGIKIDEKSVLVCTTEMISDEDIEKYIELA